MPLDIDEEVVDRYDAILQRLCNEDFIAIGAVAERVKGWHKTLQATMVIFVSEVLKAVAQIPDSSVDGRNRAAVERARKLVRELESGGRPGPTS